MASAVATPLNTPLQDRGGLSLLVGFFPCSGFSIWLAVFGRGGDFALQIVECELLILRRRPYFFFGFLNYLSDFSGKFGDLSANCLWREALLPASSNALSPTRWATAFPRWSSSSPFSFVAFTS